MKKRLLSKQTKELRILGYTGGDTIGDLIESIEDDYLKILTLMSGGYYVEAGAGGNAHFSKRFEAEADELCDALFEIVKLRLKEKL